MEERENPRSFEDILTAVEQDETLRASGGNVEAEAVGKESGGAAGNGLAGLGSMIPPELLLRLPSLLKAVQSMTEPLPVSDSRPATPVALLCALRPYMGARRRHALDTMIRLSRLSDSLGALR